MATAAHSQDIVLTLVTGASQQRFFVFQGSNPAPPFSIGTDAAWKIGGTGIGKAHVMFAFNGSQLFACALGTHRAEVDGATLERGWRPLPVPSTLRFGEGCIRIEARPSRSVAHRPLDSGNRRVTNAPEFDPTSHLEQAQTVVARDEEFRATNVASMNGDAPLANEASESSNNATVVCLPYRPPSVPPESDSQPPLLRNATVVMPVQQGKRTVSTHTVVMPAAMAAQVPEVAAMPMASRRTAASPGAGLHATIPGGEAFPRGEAFDHAELVTPPTQGLDANATVAQGVPLNSVAVSSPVAQIRQGDTATAQSMSRLYRTWHVASLPRKAAFILGLPVLVLCISAVRVSLPLAEASATSGSTSTAAAHHPPSDSTGAGAQPHAQSAAPPPKPSLPTTTDVAPDASRSAAAPSAKQYEPTSPAPTPAASRTNGTNADRTAERQALDAVARGGDHEALALYESLAKTNPDNPAFAAAARILRSRIEQADRPKTNGG